MGAFKLGKMTFGSLFKKPETVLYPLETKPQPEGLKGHITIDVDMCILCGMCDRSCPTGCITVDKAQRTWNINRFSCIQCGYCTTVCPKKCLFMEPGYAPAATERSIDTFAIPESEKKPAPKREAQEKKPAPKQEESAPEPRPEEAAPIDTLLEQKLSLMNPEKAEKVRAVLSK